MSGDSPATVRVFVDLYQGQPVSRDRLGHLAPERRDLADKMLSANGVGPRGVLLAHDADLLAKVQAAHRPRLDDEQAGALPFPVESLPEPLASLTLAAAAATSTPPEFSALPAIASIAAAIGNTAYLQVKEGWEERPNLWFAVVAETSSGKSPAQDAALAPLHMVRRDADDDYEQAKLNYEADLAAWEAIPARQRTSPKPIAPVQERFHASDATVEALRDVLAANPGVVMVLDELVSWIGSFDAYRSGRGADRAAYLSMWAGGSISVDRKGGGYVQIDHPVVAVCGGIQPELLPRLADEAEAGDGFLQRILYAYPDCEPAPFSRAIVPRSLNNDVADVIRRIRQRGRRMQACCVFDEAALARWTDWYSLNNAALRSMTGAMKALYAKLPRQLAKLVLVLHCTRYPDDPAQHPVTEEELDAGIELVLYFAWHGQRALAQIGASVPSVARSVEAAPPLDSIGPLGHRIVGVMRRLHDSGLDWITQRDLNHAVTNVGSTTRRIVRDRLVEQGRIEVQTVNAPGKGRPSERWRLVRK